MASAITIVHQYIQLLAMPHADLTQIILLLLLLLLLLV
jgi:hypothetical protein